MSMKIKNRPGILLMSLMAAGTAVGCAPKSSPTSPTAKVASVPAGSTSSPEHQFVDHVSALPMEQRHEYVTQHPDLMQKVLDGEDAALKDQFTSLIPPR